MAKAEKTIYYSFVSSSLNTTLGSNIIYSIGTSSIHIPENSISTPVSFSEVYVETMYNDICTATGMSLNRHHVAVTISGTQAVRSESATLSNTGENIAGILGPYEFLNLFTASFGTNTIASCSVDAFFTQSGGTTTGVRGVNSLMGITYIYEDTSPTQSKSIIIPLYTKSGSVTTTTNDVWAIIPALVSGTNGTEGYLVEASCSISDYFLVLEGNDCNNAGTTDFNLTYAIDSGASTALNTIETGLATDLWHRYIIKFPSSSIPSLNNTHSLNLWASTTTKHNNITAKLYVTYNFIPSLTTRYLNSYKLAMEIDSPITGGTINASQSANTFNRTLIVAEPGNIVLRNSGVEFYHYAAASPGLALRVNNQSNQRVYDSLGGVIGGMYQVFHGFGSGSYFRNQTVITEQNALPSFSNGENDIVISVHRTNANLVYNNSGYIYMNYISDTSSLGISHHPHTIEYLIRSMSATTVTENTIGLNLNAYNRMIQFRDEYWWNVAIGVENHFWNPTSVNFFATDVTLLPSESISMNQGGITRGIRRLYGDYTVGDGELTYGRWVVRARSDFKRHPRDQDSDRLHPTGSRQWKTIAAASIRYGNKLFITYHQITGSIGGTISNSNGGEVLLKLFKTSTNELYDAKSRTGDGTYSFDVYDPYTDYFVTAYEDNTYKGRSKNGTPSQDFNISLTSGGGPSYSEYWI